MDKSQILVIDVIPPYDIEDYDLFDEKDFKKFLDDVERVIRTSMEYREFTNYLREYMDFNKCSFFENVTNMNSFKIKIHIHHHPLTLYDIVLIVYNKRCAYEESLEVEMVAKEAMYIHYFLMVGLIPVSETVHDLVHDQILFIPIDRVMGNWKEFLDMYEQFVPQDIMEKINKYQEKSLCFNDEENRKYLTMNPQYIQLQDDNALTSQGTLKLSVMDTIMDTMNNRIEELRKQKYALEDKNTVDQKYDSILDKSADTNEKGQRMLIYFYDE